MHYLLLCYPKCTTCQKAKQWLDEKDIAYDLRDIKLQNPSESELTAWFKQSNLPLKRFFNTSGLVYKELQLKDKLLHMNEDEQLALLATDGMLVKRPLLVGNGRVLTGFKESEWLALL
ncbi:MAG: arsenate reductase family protein [Ruthenibacterium sp.]